MSTAVYESPQEARLVRAFLFLAVHLCLLLSFPTAMQSQPPWRFIASTFSPTPLNWCKRADGKTTQ
nr:hypothetical protein C1892_13530 [Pseudomonas sp. MPBD7-1]